MDDHNRKIKGDFCLKEIGVEGDGSCPELATHIHCRNCPEFARIGRKLLLRRTPEDYADQWTQALAEQRENIVSRRQKSVIVFRVGPQRLAMPITIVKDVQAAVSVRRIPHRSNARLRGFVNIQGDLRLCVSLHAFMELAPDSSPTATPHMIMIASGDENWVFAVDEIYGLRQFDPADVQNTPVQAAKHVDPITKGVIELDDEVIGLINENAIFKVFERSLR